jgi:uncharacterized protein (TIGR00369 family)
MTTLPGTGGPADAPIDQALAAALRARAEAIPIYHALAFEGLELSRVRCRLRIPRRREFDGVFESLHGGVLMTLADSAACFAVLTEIGADAAVTTTDMIIRFLAPCHTDATADARVIKLGRSLVPVELDLFDAAGTRVAVAQVTYFRLNKKPAR